ncbi:MAG TPA: prepilin-type N-terminal cleavage/methylation domain-containing protein [Pyrinomonadaceae bacterium]|jgi:Tfp pilus assembly protein FimT
MQADNPLNRNEAGFSLLELTVAMAITLAIMTVATTLIAASFGIRSREDTKSDAVADTVQALNIMSREIAAAGSSLPSNLGLPDNGIVAADSGSDVIRVVSNPNENTTVRDADEDVIYRLYNDTSTTPNQRYIVRYSVNSNQTTVLANRVDSLTIRYYDQKVEYSTVAGTCDISNVVVKTINAATGAVTSTAAVESTNRSKAKYLVISACVTLPQVSTPGSPSYHAAWQVQLTSDVALRNYDLNNY